MGDFRKAFIFLPHLSYMICSVCQLYVYFSFFQFARFYQDYSRVIARGPCFSSMQDNW